MTVIQVLDVQLFSKIPDDIIFEILIFTGKFILRFDKRLNKSVLASRIDLNDEIWVRFNEELLILYKKRLTRGVNYKINRNGDLYVGMYLRVTLPSFTDIFTHQESHSELLDVTKPVPQKTNLISKKK